MAGVADVAAGPRLLAFGASNSSTSINRQLVTWAAGRLEGWSATVIDLNDFEMPLFSVDREKAGGIPEAAHRFRAAVGAADALLISFAEHNGNNTAAFKNLFDWTSRINTQVWQGKPMVLLSTSPGQGGGARSLAVGETAAPFYGGEVLASLAVPKFYENFDLAEGELTDPALIAGVEDALEPLRGRFG